MDFRWRIASRTGDICEGEDNFPTPEQKSSANLFDLFLAYPCPIEAPYGQSLIADHISLVVPDDCILSFKRTVTVVYNGLEGEERSFVYKIAFEKVT